MEQQTFEQLPYAFYRAFPLEAYMPRTDLSHLTDAQLLSATDSDYGEEAWEEILNRYHSRVMRYLTMYVGNPEEAAQLTQDTFLDAFRSASSFEDGPSLAPWLFRITRNNLLPFQRRQAKLRFESLDNLLLSPALPVPISEHDGFVEGTALKDAVSLTLTALRPTLREALLLNALAGLTAREIAALLEIRTEAAEQRITRAKARFRELWHELGETGDGPRT